MTPLRARDVCALLDVTPDWFYRNRTQLEARGFPAPIAGLPRHRWHAAAVQAWLDRAGGVPAPATTALEDELRERAQRIANQARVA